MGDQHDDMRERNEKSNNNGKRESWVPDHKLTCSFDGWKREPVHVTRE